MDQHIASFGGVADGDLVFCREQGVAYQADMSRPIDYGQAYFDMYVGYGGSATEIRLNAARRRIVDHYAGYKTFVLDIGIGSGAFLASRPMTFGYDVNPVAKHWLGSRDLYRDDFENFRAFTFWDVLEHIPRPADYFDRMADGSLLFTSMPIFAGLDEVRKSKHYKPNEHFYYFTRDGFVNWMALHGFVLLEHNTDETAAGRESIGTFAFALSGRRKA